MSVWQIEPRDTLVLRDGRPMRGDATQMTSLPIPYPSTVTGVLRTQSATDEQGAFRYPDPKDEEHRRRCAQLLQLEVRGPWVGLAAADGSVEPLLPAPLDAVLFEPELPASGPGRPQQLARLGTRPGPRLGPGEQTDLDESLLPCFLSQLRSEKPAQRVPLWRWQQYRTWLERPADAEGTVEADALGLPFPMAEERTSLAMNPETGTGVDGKLFSVQHRRYRLPKDAPGERLSSIRRLCLLAECEAEGLSARTIPFAGERRAAFLSRAPEGALPTLPESVTEAIVASRRARVVLITPALFEAGFRPRWLLEERHGVHATLRAAIVGRPEVVSGWDFAKRSPKPTRRLAPAGSVYFLDLEGEPDALRTWARALWWHPISDDEQARRDGFGLAALGADEPLAEEGDR